MIVRPTTVPEIDTMIKQLPNKTSYGHDKISNIMLKALCTSITYPLCHIFNGSLSEGTFPDRMKIAEVIPLYKGKDMDSMINYRPISLLIMLSKLLEKIITLDYRIFGDSNLLYLVNTDLEQKDHANRRSWNWWGTYYSQKIEMNIVLVSF